MAWKINPCTDFEKAKKVFAKKWPAETRAVLANVVTVMRALDEGIKPEQLKLLGFVHGNYPLGILSIDETGHDKAGKPKAIRLYIFPSEKERVLYVMLLGEKNGQSKDVMLCKNFVQAKLAEIESNEDSTSAPPDGD